MTAQAHKILADALTLPDDERRLVAEALFDSVDVESRSEIEGAWRDEVVRRAQQLRDGNVESESWDEVRRAGRDALTRR